MQSTIAAIDGDGECVTLCMHPFPQFYKVSYIGGQLG